MKKTALKTQIRPFYPIALLILTGFVLSIIVFNVIREMEMQTVKSRFEHDVDNRINAVRRELRSNSEILQSVYSLFRASVEVTREEFRLFVTPIFMAHDSIKAIEWIPRVSGVERQKYESEGDTVFRITERGTQGSMVRADKREEYFPVYFVEPLKGNESKLGFDLGSREVSLKALRKSRDTGQPVITFLQEKKEEAAFLEFFPLYRKNVQLKTFEDRSRNLLGFVLGVFRIKDIVDEALLNLEAAGIDLYVYDESVAPDRDLLYYHKTRKPDMYSIYMENPEESRLSLTRTFRVVDSKWSITAVPNDEYLSHMIDWHAWWAVLGTLIIMGMLALYLNIKIRQNIRDNLYMKQIMLEEGRWEKTFNSITDLVSVHDKDMRIVRANKALSDFLGLKPEEIKGRYCYELIHHTNEPVAECPHKEVLKFRKTVTTEIYNQSADSYFMVTVSPIIEDGEIKNIIHYIKDITERKKAEAALKARTEALEKINKAFVGRELKMVELKKEIEELKNRHKA